MAARLRMPAAALLPLLFGGAVAAAESGGVAAAIAAGDPGVSLRYRYEHVDQDGIAEDADASTLKLRLNYETGDWRGWSAFGEFDHVFHVLLDDFDSGGGTSPGRAGFPVVADPEGADLNQLYLRYTMSPDWQLTVGRQRILLDNQRFVGGVGWRQNEQTYDGLTVKGKALANTGLSYSYVTYVRRIFGQDSAAGKANVDAHLLNAKVDLREGWRAVPYLYYLDYEDAANATGSTTTIGVRVEGGLAAGDGKLSITGEFASQSDAADNPLDYEERYLHAGLTWKPGGSLSLGAGIESLGGDPAAGAAFITPLATLHGFQGWADKFLATPAGGIDDVYLSLGCGVGDWNLTGVYHDFSAESGGGDYGTEFDLSAARSLGEHYGILLKAAFFNGDVPAFADTTKLWLQLTANY